MRRWPRLITGVLAAGTALAAAGAPGALRRAAASGPPIDSLQAECDYGIALAFGGEMERAEEVFTSLLSRSPGDSRAFNNLGNLYTMRGELDVARAFYDRAAEADEKDGGIRLNRATVHMMKGESAEAEAEASRAIELAGGLAEAASLLGIQAGPTEKDKGADKTRMNKQEILTLLHDALQEVPSESTVVPDSVDIASGAKKKKKGTWRSAGARGSDEADAEPILYWKR